MFGQFVYEGTYYKERLSANRLLKCYEIAPPRIKQYFEAEIQFVISNTHRKDLVLELGCGYGRVIRSVSPFVAQVVGNDISIGNLKFASSYLAGCANSSVFLMDASQMAFESCTFDVVFCVQNGISSFGIDPKRFVAESARVAKKNGMILFSSYSPKIWEERLEWFNRQSKLGLVGEIDENKTRDGMIVCKDGFKATTVSGPEFVELFSECGLKPSIAEVDESSVFACARKTSTENARY